MSIRPCPIEHCQTVDPDGNRTLIHTPICDHHRTRLLATLRNLPRTYVELTLNMTPTTGGGGERVSTSKTRPLPISTENRSLQEDMVRIVTQVEQALRYSLHLTDPPRRGREGPTLQAAARMVELQLDEALDLQHGIAIAEALLDLRRRADRLLGKTPPRPVREPCGACDCLALVRTAERLRPHFA